MSTARTSHKTWLGFSPVSWVWVVAFWSGALYEYAYLEHGVGWAVVVAIGHLIVGIPVLVAARRAVQGGAR